jgi:hypothetical protein
MIPPRLIQKRRDINNTIPRRRQAEKFATVISMSCLMTGLFAILGALYCWGAGPLFMAPASANTQLYYAEVFVCGPASIIAYAGYRKLRRWGLLASFASAGIYIYGSVMVYVSVFQGGFPFPLHLVIPPIFGLFISVMICGWSYKHYDLFQ